jgi:hypothetical protein
VNIDASDARTAADVICGALASHGAKPGAYDIGVGKLGKSLVLAVVDRKSMAERRLFIDGPDEIPLAADRIATAFAENTTVAETQGADNVVSSEVKTPLRRAAPTSVFLGVTGASAFGFDAGMSAGAEVDFEFRIHNVGFALQGRAGGIASGENFLGYGSVGVGARYYLSDADVSPFVGVGPMLAYFKANEHDVLSGYQGVGFGAAAEAGASFYRSSHAGILVALRVDVPTFLLKTTNYSYSSTGAQTSTVSSLYVAPVSLTFGLAFR